MHRRRSPSISIPVAFAVVLAAAVSASHLRAAELVQGGRSKLSAADVSSGEAAAWVAQLRREIPGETPETIVPLGAAIEVEGKLRLHAEGRGESIRFLEGELSRAKDPALRSRIRKNLNVLTLEGEAAPEIGGEETLSGPKVRLADLRGRPALLFFWANWCGDCKAEGPKLARLRERYAPKGLVLIAPTRLYGSVEANKEALPAEEEAHVQKVFGESYPGLSGVSVPVDTETMIRYGASATPTYVLVDRKGRVRFYAPTRVTEADLARRIEALLTE